MLEITQRKRSSVGSHRAPTLPAGQNRSSLEVTATTAGRATMEAKGKDAASRRERLRRLVDDMHEGELEAVETFAEFVHERGDPILRKLMKAPIDDEPVTPEEAAAIREGLDALESGDVYTFEEVKREFGD